MEEVYIHQLESLQAQVHTLERKLDEQNCNMDRELHERLDVLERSMRERTESLEASVSQQLEEWSTHHASHTRDDAAATSTPTPHPTPTPNRKRRRENGQATPSPRKRMPSPTALFQPPVQNIVQGLSLEDLRGEHLWNMYVIPENTLSVLVNLSPGEEEGELMGEFLNTLDGSAIRENVTPDWLNKKVCAEHSNMTWQQGLYLIYICKQVDGVKIDPNSLRVLHTFKGMISIAVRASGLFLLRSLEISADSVKVSQQEWMKQAKMLEKHPNGNTNTEECLT